MDFKHVFGAGAGVFFFLASAFAQSPAAMPEHITRNIRLSVQDTSAVALVTVVSVTGEGPHAKVAFKVDQAVMGTLPADIEVPLDGFYAQELEQGTQLLVSLKRLKSQDRYVCTGRYERVSEGKIREYAVAEYLGAMTAEIAKLPPTRTVAKATPPPASVPASMPMSVPEIQTPAVAPAPTSTPTETVAKQEI